MLSTQPVWDFWARFGHWLIVLCVVFQQFSSEELERTDTRATVGVSPSGWDFFTSREVSADPSMHTSRVFAKKTEQTSGYTTVGGLTVYLMLILIGLTVLSGIASSDYILFAEPS